MSETFREVVRAAEKAVAGEPGHHSEAVASMVDSLDLAEVGMDDRAHLAVLLDWLGLHDLSSRVLRWSGNDNAQDKATAGASLRNLEGMLAARRGQYNNAIESFTEAVAATREGTLLRSKVLANLAAACLEAGDTSQAASWLTKASQARQWAGDAAVDVLLASVQAGMRRLEGDVDSLRAATSALADVARSRISYLDAAHPQALIAVSNVATAEFELACAENSYERQERAARVLDIATRRLAAELGTDHPQALISMANLCTAELTLAQAEGSAPRTQEAIVALKGVHRHLVTVLGAGHPHAQLVRENLALAEQDAARAALRFAVGEVAVEGSRTRRRTGSKIRRVEPARLGDAAGSAARPVARGPGVVSVQPGSGPTVLRILLGSQLRRLREAGGITREDAGYGIRVSGSKISRMELGRVSFKERDVVDLLELYGVTDEAERATLVALAREANSPGWWHKYGDVLPDWFQVYVGLEEAAALIRLYEVQFVPGLLQTADYARAVVRLGQPGASTEEIERRVGLRAARQELLSKQDVLRLEAVVDEAALRRPIGGREVMREQITWLIEATREPNITLQVVPFSSSGHATSGAFTILRFPEDDLPDVVYVEQLTSSLYLDKPNEVERYTELMDHLTVTGAPPEHTDEILTAMLEEI